MVKLAEGSYGEVYKLLEKSKGTTASSVLDDHGGCIFKIVPLHGRPGTGSKNANATSIAAIVRESKLLKTMDVVPGFTRFRKLHVLRGTYPDSFIEAFRDFKDEGGDCSNKDPSHFSPKQLFAAIEMDDAGTDLDSLRKPSVFQVHDIFWSVVILLANAEEQVEFEHRDLHVGNICIKPWVVDGTVDIPNNLVSTMLAAPGSLLGLSGIRTTIIDYTLSRAALGLEQADIIFDPFKDASVFLARGKSLEDTRQFDNYRHMHTCVLNAHHDAHGTGPSSKKKGPSVQLWSRFVPRTNVVWLGYILYVLLLRAGRKILENSNTVAQSVQEEMYSTLEDVMDELDVELEELPTSAKELLGVAESKGWLTGADVCGFKELLEKDS